MYDRPLAALSHPNGDRLHHRAAIGGAISRLLIQMDAMQAVRAVVAMRRAGARLHDGHAAMAANKPVLSPLLAGLAVLWSQGLLFSSRRTKAQVGAHKRQTMGRNAAGTLALPSNRLGGEAGQRTGGDQHKGRLHHRSRPLAPVGAGKQGTRKGASVYSRS